MYIDMQGAFRRQAQLAVETGKALVIHARLVTPANEGLFMREFSALVPAQHPVHILGWLSRPFRPFCVSHFAVVLPFCRFGVTLAI